MPSTFTWLDYSEHDRRKMVDVISAFREQDTRDELGIGSISIGFADMLFPGTSTIQTRARYFLFIPWVYQALEQKKIPSSKITERDRSWETSLIAALAKSDDRNGIIGIEARDRLKRLPSNIYWNGLGVWGIRQFSGSQDQYHRSLDRYYVTRGRMLRSDDKDVVSGFSEPNWHAGLPPRPNGFPWEASFALRPEDSEYLRARILFRVGESLLAHLVRQDAPPAETDFIWESDAYGAFPSALRLQVDHARCFSEIIHGAALLYNLMLSEKSDWDEGVSDYRGMIAEWGDLIESRGNVFGTWDTNVFWRILDQAGARIPSRTRRFVMTWIEDTLALLSAADVVDSTGLRSLIRNRERSLKGAQARLENPRALELWSGAAGTGRLDYRWTTARTMLTDILEGFDSA